MKKLKIDQKRYNQKLQFKQGGFNQKKARIKKQKKYKKVIERRLSKTKQKITQKLLAPEEFGLIDPENRDRLISFLNKINNFLLQGYKVHISFDKTRKLLPCGTLWATAKIEHLINLYPNQISCSYPTDNVVEQLFQHIGLLRKLGKNISRAEINADNVKFWHYVSGRSTDDVAQFKTLLHSISLTEDTRSGLFESMSEAVTNTIHHAYKEGQMREWRMFAQHKEGTLTVAICDLGIGIPRSLSDLIIL